MHYKKSKIDCWVAYYVQFSIKHVMENV